MDCGDQHRDLEDRIDKLRLKETLLHEPAYEKGVGDMSTLELRLEQTIAEVQELTSAVRQLVATTPQRTKQWLEPRELAQLLPIGCC